LGLYGCGGDLPPDDPAPQALPESVLVERLARYRPINLRGSAVDLPAVDRDLLRRLIQAGEFLDRAYWEQTAPGASDLRQRLAASTAPRDATLLRLLLLNAGPYDRLLSWEPFVGESLRPPGGGFYPEFVTRDEIERRFDAASGAGEELLSPTTVVRRESGVLVAIPFHQEYREWVDPAAALLQEGAALGGDLERVGALAGCAEALLTDEYRAAEADLLSVPPANLTFALGPAGIADDRLLGLKRSYGALIGRVDAAASERLAVYGKEFAALLSLLPAGGTPAAEGVPTLEIVAIADLYRGGAFAYGFQEGSLLLPLDPRAGASMRLLISPGVVAARVEHLVLPVSTAVAELQRSAITTDSATAIALMHAVGHALGPRQAGPPGAQRLLAEALRDEGAWVEEAKAEAVGFDALQGLRKGGTLPASGSRGDATSALAGLIAAARQGDGEPAGLAATVALNWHREHGGITYDHASATWAADLERMGDSANALAKELLEIQSMGDRAGAARLRQTYGKADPDLRATLRRLASLPAALAPRVGIDWD
jgi:hypothetical protein